MGKFAQYINKNANDMKQVFARYLVTILCAVCMSIVFIIEDNIDGTDAINSIMAILVMSAIGSFFAETVFKNPEDSENSVSNLHRERNLIIGYIVGFVVSIVTERFSTMLRNEIIEDQWEIKIQTFEYIVSFYAACLIGFSLYTIIRQQKITVSAYVGRVVFSLLRALGVFLVLNLAAMLLLKIVDTLLFEFDYFDVLGDIEILLASCVYFPTCLEALTNTKEDNSRFTKRFVSYVLMPCVWIAMVIIYLYIIKIFVKMDIPSNEIFGICEYLFLIGTPIWMMTEAFLDKDKSKYRKMVHITKYIYAPFLLLEIYSIGVRIHAYGVTESRYVAVVFILVQIIYIFWEPIQKILVKFRKKPFETESGLHYEYMIFVLLGIGFIVLFLPYGNVSYLSYSSQKERLLTYQESDKAAAGEAYRYLKYNPYGERYIDTHFTEQQIAEFESTEYYESPYKVDWTYVKIYSKPLEEGLTIGPEYHTLYAVHEQLNGTQPFEDLGHVDITVGDQKIKDVDLRDCIEYYAELDEKEDNLQDSELSDKEYLYEMQIDDNRKLIIYTISFDYTYGMNEIRDFYYDGYLLEK